MEYKTLSNGNKMPMLGYGVFLVSPDECVRCVSDALEIGYRSIDTAQYYFNEAEVGKAIKDSGIKREDIFLTTKVWYSEHDREKCKASIYRSLEKLKTDYLDLCLIHHPVGDIYSAYRGLEDLYREGVIKNIGVSNFYPALLVNICSFCEVKPVVNQIEVHPSFQQSDALIWAGKYGVAVEAWSPMGRGQDGLFDNPTLKAISEKYGKSTAQIMLKWNIQRGVIVIPKSVRKERIKENFELFDFTLSDEDMSLIATLDKGKSVFFDHRTPETAERFIKKL